MTFVSTLIKQFFLQLRFLVLMISYGNINFNLPNETPQFLSNNFFDYTFSSPTENITVITDFIFLTENFYIDLNDKVSKDLLKTLA